MTLRDVAPDNGGGIGQVDRYLSTLHISNGLVALLIAVEILVALWVVVPGRVRQVSVIAGCVIVASAWVIVQGLGDLTSGQATDPNSGPRQLDRPNRQHRVDLGESGDRVRLTQQMFLAPVGGVTGRGEQALGPGGKFPGSIMVLLSCHAPDPATQTAKRRVTGLLERRMLPVCFKTSGI